MSTRHRNIKLFFPEEGLLEIGPNGCKGQLHMTQNVSQNILPP